MKDIFLIRHGRQSSKLCNTDVVLEEAGKKQAELLGKRLVSYQLEKIYSSDLLRAKETAQIANDSLQIPYETLADIHEIDFGGLTGKTDEEIKKVYGDFLAERATHKEDISYPQGECGADVVRRVMPQLRYVCEQPEDRVAIVTHGGVIRSVCAEILQTEQKNKLKFALSLENTSITHIIYDSNRDMFFLERFNDFAHLEGKEELLRSGWKTSLEKRD